MSIVKYEATDENRPFAIFELPEVGESGILGVRGYIWRREGQWQTVFTRECAWDGSEWTEIVDGKVITPPSDLFAEGVLPAWVCDALSGEDPLVSYDTECARDGE